jgi:hypothetical protein
MKKSALAFALLAAGLVSAIPVRASFVAQAALSGANSVPSNDSTANGLAVVIYNSNTQDLTYNIFYQGLSAPVSAGHIHVGAAGVNGPIILPFVNPDLNGTTNFVTGVLTAADLNPSAANGINTFADAIAAIEAGNTYVNLHNTNFPGGEIRGQLAVTATTIPEPATFALVGSFFGAAALLRLRRRRS